MVTRKKRASKNGPPSKIKIANALRTLLKTKDFHSITTAELAGLAQANEALIYRYFGDKRGVLHDILEEYLKTMHEKIEVNLDGLDGAFNRLEQIVRDTVNIYNQERVFAKIVLVESRNFPGFFESRSYERIKKYAALYTATIKEGIAGKELKDDIVPEHLRNIIIGMIEHLVMPHVIFNTPMDTAKVTRQICTTLLHGIRNQSHSDNPK